MLGRDMTLERPRLAAGFCAGGPGESESRAGPMLMTREADQWSVTLVLVVVDALTPSLSGTLARLLRSLPARRLGG
jgi:hypothetical protein